jgi:hypothetical protein
MVHNERLGFLLGDLALQFCVQWQWWGVMLLFTTLRGRDIVFEMIKRLWRGKVTKEISVKYVSRKEGEMKANRR